MRRRDLIAGGFSAAVMPVRTVAQSQKPTICFFNSGKASTQTKNLAAFRGGLKQVGFIEGSNVVIRFVWAENQYDRLPDIATQVVSQRPAVIVSNTLAAVRAKASTSTIPIVFTTGSDPVRDGLVDSLSRPGANVTGVVFVTGTLGAKRLEMLRQFLPKITVLGMLVYPGTRETDAERIDVKTAATALGMKVQFFDIRKTEDLDSAFTQLSSQGVNALLIGAGPFLFNNRTRIVELASLYKIPSMYSLREFADAGGLISYGTSFPDAYTQAGQYAGRILKGEKPRDLPVIQSSKFELVINLRTAKALNLEFHPQLLATADEVIE